MNIAKAPDDEKNWREIDIFLFTNGQQYSPPRKYHLKSEELSEWSVVLSHIARSQFGSLHSSIEIYTLDGKKIETPLEFVADESYVAVKPPDAFIQTGYEKYLLKATRSREKRQEKLNNADKERSDTCSIEMNKEQLKSSGVIQNYVINNNTKNLESVIRKSLDTEKQSFPATANNIATHGENKSEVTQKVRTSNNPVTRDKPELLKKEKLVYPAKNTILKKFSHLPDKSKVSGQTPSKKRNTSFSASVVPLNDNNKKVTTLKTTVSPKPNDDDTNNKVEFKISPQSDTYKAEDILPEIKEESDRQLQHFLKKELVTTSSVKDLTILSDVYKNTDSDVQSVFLDADRKTALINNDQKKISHDANKFNYSVESSTSPLKLNNTIKQNDVYLTETHDREEASLPNQAGTINLNLNIDFKGCKVLKNCKTSMHKHRRISKLEKASQVDMDGALSNSSLNFDKEIFNQDAKIGEEFTSDTNKKVLIVHCKCDVVKSHENFLCINTEENDSCILLIPTQITDNVSKGCDPEISKRLEKQSQHLLQSCIRPSCNVQVDKFIKPRVSISQYAVKQTKYNINDKTNEDTPVLKADDMKPVFKDDNLKSDETKSVFEHDNLPSDEAKLIFKEGNLKSNETKAVFKVNNFTQTEWCNIVLQAIPNGDGCYTFHLPPLNLLTQYKLNF